jgi:YVTN family beta-propeller protein
VIATATNTVGSIMVGGFPTGVAVTPGGRKVYVSNGHTDDVSVIATATDKVTRPSATTASTSPPGVASSSSQDLSGRLVPATVMARAWRRSPGRLAASVARPQPRGYPDVQGLQTEIRAYCGSTRMSRGDENE